MGTPISQFLLKIEQLMEQYEKNEEQWAKEVPQEYIEELITTNGSLENKVDTWVGFLRSLKMQETASEDDYQIAKKQRSRILNVAKSTKAYLSFVMKSFDRARLTGIERESGAAASISLVNNSQESLKLLIDTREVSYYSVIDETVTGFVEGLEPYMQNHQVYTLNTTKLRADLLAGVKLNWASLQRDQHIRFKP